MSFSPRPRVFAIGDIHGCANELNALLAKLRPASDDTVVFLGDYVDRGPNAKGVIDQILELSKRTNVIALKGNHEEMLLQFLEEPDAPGAGMFVVNGGSATLASYAADDGIWEIPEEHLTFFKSLRLYWETESHFFVHAGLPARSLSTLDFKDEEVQAQMLWTRQPFLSTQFVWEKTVVHGHTPVPKIEKLPNRINLDTGCVYGNVLTALELPSNTFHSVARGAHRAGDSVLTEPARISRRFAGQLPVRAGRSGGAVRAYETLNYNQFGLLMRDASHAKIETLKRGDLVSGEIGLAQSSREGDIVKFVGTVVRTDTRGEYVLYAIRIEKISGGVWGPNWVERPAS